MVTVKTDENNGMSEFMNTHVLRNFVWSMHGKCGENLFLLLALGGVFFLR
jgi:hypothetical protein